MAMNYSEHFSSKKTSQRAPIPGKSMVKNSAGGYTFQIDPAAQMKRFLILGAEGGTYYASAKKLTVENAEKVIDCVKAMGPKAVQLIVDVSDAGRAPKNDAAIFSLALAATYGDAETKAAAYAAIPKVCRIGTHIFAFCQAIQDMRGWSRGLRSGVARYYTGKEPHHLALDLVKYRQRNGWTHRDVLRLAHPKAATEEMSALFQFAAGKPFGPINAIVSAYLEAQSATPGKAVKLIREHRLPREALPTELLNSPEVWTALLQDMPMTAMIRNLGKMGAVGILTSNFDDAAKRIAAALGDAEAIRNARVHPLQLLVAMKTYGNGRGEKGSLTWKPVDHVLQALESAFYQSFGNVQPTGKNFLLGLDVSGSMDMGTVAGIPLTPREATAAMAMLVARVEPNYEIVAFSEKLHQVRISRLDSLQDIMKRMAAIPFGGTDCALPMLAAEKFKLPIDVFQIYTDNETHSGGMHPAQALKSYRQASGRNGKLAVVATTSTGFSIADPADTGMMDVVGFDTATPDIISTFAQGF